MFESGVLNKMYTVQIKCIYKWVQPSKTVCLNENKVSLDASICTSYANSLYIADRHIDGCRSSQKKLYECYPTKHDKFCSKKY